MRAIRSLVTPTWNWNWLLLVQPGSRYSHCQAPPPRGGGATACVMGAALTRLSAQGSFLSASSWSRGRHLAIVYRPETPLRTHKEFCQVYLSPLLMEGTLSARLPCIFPCRNKTSANLYVLYARHQPSARCLQSNR